MEASVWLADGLSYELQRGGRSPVTATEKLYNEEPSRIQEVECMYSLQGLSRLCTENRRLIARSFHTA